MNVMSNSSLFKVGSSVVVYCPSGCNESVTPVFGSGLYHSASSICKAALHANTLLPTGGKVMIKTHKAAKNYIGTNSNGINSEDFKVNDGNNSFSITAYKSQCPIDMYANLKPEDKKTIEASSSFVEMQTEIKNVIEETVYGANNRLKNIDPNEFEALDPDDIKELGVAIKKTSDTKLNKEFDDYINNPQNSKSLRFSENEQLDPSMAMNTLNNVMNDMANPADTLKNKIQNGANEAMNKLANPFGNTKSGNKYPGGPGSNYPNGMNNAYNPYGIAPNQPIQPSYDKYLPNSPNIQNPNIPIPNVPITEAEKQANNMLKNKLNKEKQDLEKAEAKKDVEEKLNTPPGGVPSVPDSSPNGSPREPDVSPEKEEKSVEDNGSCSPSTDEANAEIKTIRTSADWDWLTSVKIKSEKVKEIINLFSKNLAWSKADSEYSNETLKCNNILI